MTSASANLPAAVDRAAFQAELDALRDREKAHTREGDAIAAARRRLPMVEVDASLELTGPDGPVTLLDAFEGRRHMAMWWYRQLEDRLGVELGVAPGDAARRLRGRRHDG